MNLFNELIEIVNSKESEIQDLVAKISSLKDAIEYNKGILSLRNQQINNLKNEINQYQKLKDIEMKKVIDINMHTDDINSQCNELDRQIVDSQKERAKFEYNKLSLEEHIAQIQEKHRIYQNEEFNKRLSEIQSQKQCLKLDYKQITDKINELNRCMQLIKENTVGTIQTKENEQNIWKQTRNFKIATLKAQNESLSQLEMQNNFKYERSKDNYDAKLSELREMREKENIKICAEYNSNLNDLREIYEQKYFYFKQLDEKNNANISKAKQETDIMHSLRVELAKIDDDVKKIQTECESKIKRQKEECMIGVERIKELNESSKQLIRSIIAKIEQDPHQNALLQEFRERQDIQEIDNQHRIIVEEDKTKVMKNKFEKTENYLKSIWTADKDLENKLVKSRKAVNSTNHQLKQISKELKAKVEQIKKYESYIPLRHTSFNGPVIVSTGINTPIIIRPGANVENVEKMKEAVRNMRSQIKGKTESISQMRREYEEMKLKNKNLKTLIIKLAKLTKRSKS